MGRIRKLYGKWSEFFALARTLDDVYVQRTAAYNNYVMVVAALLTLAIECTMVVRLLISHPAINTPASRVYLAFYLSLIAVACGFLLVLAKVHMHAVKAYWLQYTFVGCYLLWNVALNSYDLYRNGRGSSLALVTAIIFASVFVRFRPHHMILLQSTTFFVFFFINQGRIEDEINASIAVVVALVINVVFYVQDIQSVDQKQKLFQANAHLEKEQMDGAMQYLRRLKEAQGQSAVYHHDLRHTVRLVEQLALQGDVAKLQEFVAESQAALNQLQSESPMFYCEHETANLILGSFAQRATERDVAFDAEVALPQNLQLSDATLCALLSNLLENALHAAAQADTVAQRHIYIKALLRDGQLVILVENGFAGRVIMRGGRPVPKTAQAQHGFGIQSIVSIADRHQGFATFVVEDQKFCAKVLLRMYSAAG